MTLEQTDCDREAGGPAGSRELPQKADPASPRGRPNLSLRGVLEIPVLIAGAIVVTLVVKAFLAQAFYIPSESMAPQLLDHDRVVVSRTAYRLHEPRRGDIIVFPSPAVTPPQEGVLEGLLNDVLEAVALRQPGDRELIKRVVGLPGETIQASGGQVQINGQPLVEPYLREGVTTADFGPVTVPEGFVFVLGDNRGNSHDSRYGDVGPIEIDSIIGRAIARVWPPNRTAFL